MPGGRVKGAAARPRRRGKAGLPAPLPATSTAGHRRWGEAGAGGPARGPVSRPPGCPGGGGRSEGPPQGPDSLPGRQAPALPSSHPLPSQAARDSRHRCPRSVPTPQPERRHCRAVLGGEATPRTELRVPAARPGPPRGRCPGTGGLRLFLLLRLLLAAPEGSSPASR